MDVNIKAESVFTANKTRDKHLRGEGFFDIEKYPSIIYHSSAVKSNSFEGYITLLSTTKPMIVPFEVLKDNEGNFYLKGAVSFNRVDYGMEDKFGAGEEVNLSIDLRLVKN